MKAQFPHDCERCVLVRTTEKEDWYWCGDTLLGRYGPSPESYWSHEIVSIARTTGGSDLMLKARDTLDLLLSKFPNIEDSLDQIRYAVKRSWYQLSRGATDSWGRLWTTETEPKMKAIVSYFEDTSGPITGHLFAAYRACEHLAPYTDVLGYGLVLELDARKKTVSLHKEMEERQDARPCGKVTAQGLMWHFGHRLTVSYKGFFEEVMVWCDDCKSAVVLIKPCDHEKENLNEILETVREGENK